MISSTYELVTVCSNPNSHQIATSKMPAARRRDCLAQLLEPRPCPLTRARVLSARSCPLISGLVLAALESVSDFAKTRSILV
jgi:hypothetical protein